MLIRSSFHDFYDSITAFGVDKSVVYVRTPSELKSPMNMPDREDLTGLKGMGVEVYKHAIGFCGKVFPVVEFQYSVSGKITRVFCYTPDKAQEFLKNFKIRKSKYQFYWRGDFHVRSDTGLLNFFSAEHWKPLEKLFQKYKVPVFAVVSNYKYGIEQDHVLRLNPRLKDFNFAQVVHPLVAFQDVYMFISGVLGIPQKTLVEVSDKVKAAKKGHGDKYSFRKPPTKRK